MKRPATTEPPIQNVPNEPKMPRMSERARPDAGGKESSTMSNFSGDTQIKPPSQFEHISTAIEPQHIFGEKVEGSHTTRPMHLGPNQFSPVKLPGKGMKEGHGHGASEAVVKSKIPKVAKISKPQKA